MQVRVAIINIILVQGEFDVFCFYLHF